MIELEYHFKDFHGNDTYVRLSQDNSHDFWLIRDGEFTMARISEIQGVWNNSPGR
jgi:hypothetical protein